MREKEASALCEWSFEMANMRVFSVSSDYDRGVSRGITVLSITVFSVTALRSTWRSNMSVKKCSFCPGTGMFTGITCTSIFRIFSGFFLFFHYFCSRLLPLWRGFFLSSSNRRRRCLSLGVQNCAQVNGPSQDSTWPQLWNYRAGWGAEIRFTKLLNASLPIILKRF